MDRLLRLALQSLIRRGTLDVATARGATFRCGDGAEPRVAIRFTTAGAQRGILLDPDLRLGECYMDGTLVIERDTIAALLELVFGQDPMAKTASWALPRWCVRYIARRRQQWNRQSRSRKNVAHHYDLDGRLYALFLDGDRQHSCAYFETPDQSLDDAQLAKKRHLAAKLLIERGNRILDIGSGWGGLALYFAEICGAHVTGVTLSKEQLHAAAARAGERGLSDAANFRLQDYRELNGTFDRIVSLGMFEHVGIVHYNAYFRECAARLADDGVMVLHAHRAVGIAGRDQSVDCQVYFPGRLHSFALGGASRDRAGRIARHRHRNPAAALCGHAEGLARALPCAPRGGGAAYDERCVRMWEFYLAASEMAFRGQNMMVFQIQIAKRQGVVPMTHDYIMREEDRCGAAGETRVRRCDSLASESSSMNAPHLKLPVSRCELRDDAASVPPPRLSSVADRVIAMSQQS